MPDLLKIVFSIIGLILVGTVLVLLIPESNSAVCERKGGKYLHKDGTCIDRRIIIDISEG